MANLFTSYSRKDAAFVDQISSELRSNGLKVWTDRLEIQGGQNWRSEIAKAIDNCYCLLLVLSPQSSESKYVIQEVTLADKKDKQIVPVLYQKCTINSKVELALAGIHIIDYTIQEPRKATSELLKSLGKNYAPDPLIKKQRKTLVEILPGSWQVQLTLNTPMGPRSELINIVINSNYTFNLASPFFRAQGNWSIPQFNHLILNGIKTNGYVNMAYYTVIQFTDLAAMKLTGLTSGNEGTLWQKI